MAHQPRQTTFRGLDVTKMAGRRVSAPVPEKRAPPADSDDNFLSHSPSKRARVSIGNVVFESRAEVLEVAIGDRPRRPEQRLMKFSASQGSVAAKMLNVRAEQVRPRVSHRDRGPPDH